MKDLVKSLENFLWLVHVILVLIGDLFGNLLRLFESLASITF